MSSPLPLGGEVDGKISNSNSNSNTNHNNNNDDDMNDNRPLAVRRKRRIPRVVIVTRNGSGGSSNNSGRNGGVGGGGSRKAKSASLPAASFLPPPAPTPPPPPPRRSRQQPQPQQPLSAPAAAEATENIIMQDTTTLPSSPLATPRKKRVRFSDPGPAMASGARDDGEGGEEDWAGNSSTGLTPALQRHRLVGPFSSSSPPPPLSPTPSSYGVGGKGSGKRGRASGAGGRQVARRRSLPAKLGLARARADAPAAGNGVEETTVQFEPLRQVIDGRVKRRLRRNRLSEELNRIEAERKQEDRRQVRALKSEIEERNRWVAELKQRLAAAEEGSRRQTLLLPLPPSERCLGGIDAPSLMTHVRDGGDDNDDADADDGNNDDNAGKSREPQMEIYDGGSSVLSIAEAGQAESAEDGAAEAHENSMAGLSGSFSDQYPLTPPSVAESENAAAPSSVQASFREDAAGARPQAELKQQIAALKAALQHATTELEAARATQQHVSARLQSHLQHTAPSLARRNLDLDAALGAVITATRLAHDEAEDFEASLMVLASDVIELGFRGRDVGDMLHAIKAQFRAARLQLERLQPGETAGGFDNEQLLGTLLERIRHLLRQVHDGADAQDEQRAAAAAQLQQQLDAADARAAQAAEAETAAEARVRELAADVDDKERSIANLRRALDSYRAEVRGLEELVTRLEREHADAAAQQQRHMDEAVADLEQRLEAETRSKEDIMREAQAEKRRMEELQAKVDRAMSVIERMQRERDLLLAAKDDAISRIETEAGERERASAAALAEREARVEALCQEKAALESSLSKAEASVDNLTSSNIALEARLGLEIDNGIRVMEAMQTEMMKSLARVGELKNKYINSKHPSDGSSPALPATPCSMRFTTPQKKRRTLDSGIGVVEEEDEDMVDV